MPSSIALKRGASRMRWILWLLIALVAGCASPPPTIDWVHEGLARDVPNEVRQARLGEVSVEVASDSLSVNGDMVRQALSQAMATFEGTGQGVLLDLRLRNVRLEHDRGNEEATSAFLWWLFLGAVSPGLFIEDQVYVLEADVDLRVMDAATKQELLPWQSLEKVTAERALNFHDRTGSSPWPYMKTLVFFIPPAMVAVDPERVLPYLLSDALRPLVKSVAARLREVVVEPIYRIDARPRQAAELQVSVADDAPWGFSRGSVDVPLVIKMPRGVKHLREVRIEGVTVFDNVIELVDPNETTLRIKVPADLDPRVTRLVQVVLKGPDPSPRDALTLGVIQTGTRLLPRREGD
jgi:hypothetical protein